MFERIKTQLMTRHYIKQKEVEGFVGNFCPKIRSKVIKNSEFANLCFAMPAGHGVFQIQFKEYNNTVDILAKTCDCRRWQLTGIRCCHAIACLRHERIPAESMLPDCYSVQTFQKAYEFSIWHYLVHTRHMTQMLHTRQHSDIDDPNVISGNIFHTPIFGHSLL
jgi:hypothetical protein